MWETVVSNLTLEYIDNVVSKFSDPTPVTEVFDVNWVNICGTECKHHHMLCYDFMDDMPCFGQIQHILVHRDIVYFILLVWITLH